jgi:hypothetical protein
MTDRAGHSIAVWNKHYNEDFAEQEALQSQREESDSFLNSPTKKLKRSYDLSELQLLPHQFDKIRQIFKDEDFELKNESPLKRQRVSLFLFTFTQFLD